MVAWAGLRRTSEQADDDARLLMEHEAAAEEWAAYEAHMAARSVEIMASASVADWDIDLNAVPF